MIVAKLTAEEQAQLDALTAKSEAPDEQAGSGRNVNITVDLSDAAAVKRALSLGLIDKGDLAEFDDDGTGDGDGDGDDDDDAGDGEPAPRRRLSLADRTMGAGGAK